MMRIKLANGKIVNLSCTQLSEAISAYLCYKVTGRYPEQGLRYDNICNIIKDEGNKNSGNWGHAGRHGEIGGSAKSASKELEEKILSGEIKTHIHPQKQREHVKGTKEYEQALENGKKHPSLLTLDKSEWQGIVDTYTRTGKARRMNDGSIVVYFEHTSTIGRCVSQDGTRSQDTCCGTIHYSGSGTHIVPAWPYKGSKDGKG